MGKQPTTPSVAKDAGTKHSERKDEEKINGKPANRPKNGWTRDFESQAHHHQMNECQDIPFGY